MRRFSRPMLVACASAILLAFGFGLIAVLSTSTVEAGCRCPLIYAPVKCDHDKVYPNPCVAECHHAKNCVPTGEL